MAANTFRIAVLPGDGIGIEVMAEARRALEIAERRVGGFSLVLAEYEAGADCYVKHGIALPDATFDACANADAILLGAAGMPSIRYPDGTEIMPQVDLRIRLNLYAGIRPIRSVVGSPPVLANPKGQALDLVLIRESTEGLFASKDKGIILNDQLATETLIITRATCERLFDVAFKLATQRKARGGMGKVTCVDKANVFSSFAFFRRIFYECASRYPDINATHAYVDAMALDLVRRPWDYDVLVTENMFGDILSDLGAGLIGGMGMAPSADIGDAHAVFQPSHGTAPDIMGQGKANPTAMILSAGLMLDWLGQQRGSKSCTQAGRLIQAAVDHAYAGGRLKPFELGGASGTKEISEAVFDALETVDIKGLAA